MVDTCNYLYFLRYSGNGTQVPNCPPPSSPDQSLHAIAPLLDEEALAALVTAASRFQDEARPITGPNPLQRDVAHHEDRGPIDSCAEQSGPARRTDSITGATNMNEGSASVGDQADDSKPSAAMPTLRLIADGQRNMGRKMAWAGQEEWMSALLIAGQVSK
jgi:hypothetical protein